jgi:hypothetical protein
MVDTLLLLGLYVVSLVVLLPAIKWINTTRPRKRNRTHMVGALIAMTLVTAQLVGRVPMLWCLLLLLVPVAMVGFGFWLYSRKW